MIRSVAVLSDIHGVLPALEAALADPRVGAAERIVVTGDICAGPQPAEVLDRLIELRDRVTLVRGNADRELVAIIDGERAADDIPIDGFAASELSRRPDLVEVLRNLPHPVVLDLDGFGPVLFCHGTPRDDDEVVLVDTRPQRWLEVIATVADDVRTVVCGHTHMPYLRLVEGRTIVNAGSVGMPYGGAGAQWALLEDGAVTLGRTTFDVAAARLSISRTCTFDDVDAWTEEYLYSRNSDIAALAAFGPRDGR